MLMMIGALAALSFGQETKERVQLKAGSDTKSLTRTIGPNGSVDVTFRVTAGETIGFTAGYDFKDSDIQVFLMKTGDQDTLKTSGPKAPNEYLVSETGDYNVLVRNMTRKSITTTIYLDLFSAEHMADANSDIETESLDFTGSDMAIVSKSIPANGTMKFTFNGEKNVTALVKVTEKTNKLTVVFNENENQKADMTIDLNREVARKLSRSGQYTIEVINQSARSVKFDLEVTFASTAAVPSTSPKTVTEEVQFGAGKTAAYLKRSLNANGSIEFSFHAKKGQRVNYSANYNMNNGLNSQDLEVFFMNPGAQDFLESGTADEPNEFRVKTSGFHTVMITNKTGKKVSFEFVLSIV